MVKDPWNAAPAGVADEFSSPTAAMKLKSAVTLATNNVGNAALAIQAGSLQGFHFNTATVNASTEVIANWTAANVAHPDYASMIATYNKYRPVSIGVKVYYIGAEQTTSGLIMVSAVEGIGTPTVTNFPTNVSEIADLPNTKTIAPATMVQPICVAAHMFDRPKFAAWTSTDWVDFFPTIVVGVSGALASAQCVRIECTLNLELLPLMTAFAAHHFVAPVPSNPTVVTAVRRLPTSRVGYSESEVIGMANVSGVKRTTSGTRKRRSSRPAPLMMANTRSIYKRGSGGKRRKTSRRKRKLYRRR